MSQTIQLGTMSLFGDAYGPFTLSGGYFEVKQVGATSLRTGACKGDPKGSSVKLAVVFASAAEASAFLAYIAPFDPDDPNFSEEDGANIPLYIRDADWHYNVYAVVARPEPISRNPMDYIQYSYEVVCYLYSPYSEAATPQTFAPALTKIRVTANGTLYALDANGIVHTYSAGWAPLTGEQPAAFIQITANNSSLLAITAAGAAYSYSAGTWSAALGGATGLKDISIASDGTIYATDSSNKLRRWNGATLDDLTGECYQIAAIDSTHCYVRGGDYNLWRNNGTSGDWTQITTSADTHGIQVASDAAVYGISTTDNAVKLSGSTWVSLAKTVISASPKSSTEAYYIASDGSAWKYATTWSQPMGSPSLDNSDGHISSSPDVEITCGYLSGNAEDVTVSIADGLSLILCDVALSDEILELVGNENKLFQTYEDTITAGTVWGHDWTGDGTFDTDHMELDDEEEAYILLSGPHQIRTPIKMTADLSLDSGGATNEAYVQISPDGVAWETVLDQDDFESGSAEYALQGSTYMTDCYVRLYCASGTSGKNLNIGAIKFEVERWIEYGAVPVVAAGAAKVMTISATGGSITVIGTFAPRHKFI